MNRFALENRTPHPLSIHVPGDVIELPGPGDAPIPRLIDMVIASTTVEAGIDHATDDDAGWLQLVSVPVTMQQFGPPVDLPERTDGVLWIVSRVVAEAVPGRDDLLFPGPAVRDDSGRIVGCQGLSRAAVTR